MTNRLAAEASPYLKQHSENPVDWYPWGEEALARAKREDKPILLSIGYSACHWCHVMERESFEDLAIAKLMNELFVNVKVDREERPDLDQIYQLTVQLLGRNGGWPLTVFLTPSQKPFFGGTYFPPTERHGMPAFPKILAAVAEAYRERRDDVELQAEELTRAIASVAGGGDASSGPVPRDVLARAIPTLERRFDDEHGGFGARPKFPNTMALDLLRLHGLRGDDRSLARVRRALDGMRDGGIHDQLGGGFHRYSTDERWLVPHFEKMLSDNALLLRAYAEGHRLFADDSYAEVARGIVAYLERDMMAPSGAFYASEDADSEGEEGRYFVFRPSEVRAALAGDELAIEVALRAFGIGDEGNFEDTGASVLHRATSPGAIALALGRAPSEVESALDRARQALLEARSARVRPLRDEKILASWNALTIEALAHASAALGEGHMLELATKAWAHLRRTLITERGAGVVRVQRLEKDGVVKGPGFLDDQAYALSAAIELHQVTGAATYLDDARALGEGILADFLGEGGFEFSPRDGERLIAAPKDAYDQAVPSGAAVAMLGLAFLGDTVDERFAAPARKALEQACGPALENPFGYATTLRALDQLARGAVEVFVSGSPDESSALAAASLSVPLPHLQLLRWSSASAGPIPMLAQGRLGTPARAFVCVGQTCSLPIDVPSDLVTHLRTAAKSLK